MKIKIIDDKLEELNDRIVAFENSYAEKHQQIKHIFENKLEIFVTNLNTLKRVISEKENYIQSLETTVSRIQEENKYKSYKIENFIKELNILLEACNRPTIQFKCQNCDFETTSEKELKQHNSKKHTKTEKMGRKFECEH